MGIRVTRSGFFVLAAVGVAAVVGLLKVAVNTGFLGKPTEIASVVPETTKIDKFNVTNDVKGTYDLPATAKPVQMASCPTIEVIPWNAIGGLSLANGGTSTQRGSLVEKYTGGCLNIKRQDDYGQMEANMTAFINSNGAKGDAFFIIMGDGSPYVTAALQKLIPDQYSLISTIGFSDGEDQCMLPSDAAKDPQKARGSLIAAVPRDGDWNICVKWASDNGIPINVDQKSYDPSAMNFVDVDSFVAADQKLIAKACEDRTVVENKIAHGTKRVCVNGVATWTPGDVDVVQKYDGSIIGVASTRDYAGQMPAIIVGAKSWMASHRDYVVGLLKAVDRGSMAVRSSNEGLTQMGVVHAQIFGEQNGAFWSRLYKGDVMQNKAGESVRVGGSKVATLQEARDYFGLRNGTTNIFASVYRVFKGYDETFYPTLYPKVGGIPAYDSVVDLSYLQEALKGIPETEGTVNPVLAVAAPITQQVSKKSWHIEFETGKATIKPESVTQLYEIEDTAAITNLRLRFDGHTDNTGSAAINVPLSQARAEAVAKWLNEKAPANFPMSRMEARGHGSESPLCTEATEACRAQNRRVEIVLGQ